MSTNLERNVLPLNPNPTHYRVSLVPDLKAFTFKGTIDVDLDVSSPTDTIEFNAVELTIHDAVVHQGDRVVTTVDGSAITLDAGNERALIKIPQSCGPLSCGKARLFVNYTGVLNDKMKGFYRSRYTVTKEDGTTCEEYMGTTQFEPTDARRALPCWDEPARKASFELSITIPSNLMAVSNTSELSSVTLAGGLKRVSFSPTPVMSTYLLAFAIGQFDWVGTVIPKTRGGSTVLRVLTLPGHSARGRYALELASRILPLYETFFGSDYVLEKLDQLAIPDFSAGAMENWGIVTYRETALLCDDTSSAAAKQRVALVVAHELAHQWFGNLVTMDWWKELWLNEAFATWVEYLAVDRLYPEWEIWTQFVNDETGRALSLDALVSSHPIEVDIRNAQEVDEIFDAISYSKGGAVLNMIVSFLGVDTLTAALCKYLNTFKYRNATTKDLWSFLEKESGKPVTEIMSTWTDKQGYPLLEVARKDASTITISQRRFLSTGTAPAELDTVIWPVPLRISAGSKNVDIIFQERSGTVDLGEVSDAAFVLVNVGQTAVCRVSYSGDLFKGIVAHVTSLKSVDRLGLVRDMEAFAEAGVHPTSDLLALLSAMCPTERDLTVWCSIASAESSVKQLLLKPELREKYQVWAAKLYGPCAQALGWDAKPGDNHRLLQMRGLVYRRLVAARDAETLAAARALFRRFLEDPNAVAGDVRLAVFTAEVLGGGWDAVREVYEAATDAAEKTRCLTALGCGVDEATLRKALEYATSDKVRGQDMFFLLGTIASTVLGMNIVFDFVKEKFQYLFERFDGGFMMTRVLKCLDGFACEEKAVEISEWWKTIPDAQRLVADRTVKQVIEVVRTRHLWRVRSEADIEKFLSSL